MNKLRNFSRNSNKDNQASPTPESKSPSSELSASVNIPKRAVTAESKGELSPALSPIVSLLSAQTHRNYNEGVFMLLKDLDSDGNPADRKWTEVYGVLTGNQLAIWDVELLDGLTNHAATTDNKPTYINFTDATFKAVDKLPSTNGGELNNVIIVSTTLKNRFLIQISSIEQYRKWHAAFRLSSFEYTSLQEAYTGALLSARGSMLSDIRVILAETKFVHEEWISVRFGAGMPWKRCFTVIEPPQKKSKKKIIRGKVHFYENEKKGKKLAMATIVFASSIYAVYPQNYTIIDHSTMIKLDGSIVFTKQEGEKDCSIFLMPEQHSSVPGYDTLIRFLIPLLDAFQLYGRPKRLNADKTDIGSLLFALPVLPKVHYLEVDDLLVLTGSSTTNTWLNQEWNNAIKDILKNKLLKGYTGCGSADGVTGAVNVLDFSKDFAAGKIRSFPNSPALSSFSPKVGFERTKPSSLTANNTNDSLYTQSSTPPPVTAQEPFQQQKQEILQLQPADVNVLRPEASTPRNSYNMDDESSTSSKREMQHMSMSPRLLNIYKKYAQIPNTGDATEKMAKLSMGQPDGLDDLYPNNEADLYPKYEDEEEEEEGEESDEESDFEIPIIKPTSNTISSESVNSNGFLKTPIQSPSERVLSPYTDFHNTFQRTMQSNLKYSNHDQGSASGDSLNYSNKPLPVRNDSIPPTDSTQTLPKQRKQQPYQQQQHHQQPAPLNFGSNPSSRNASNDDFHDAAEQYQQSKQMRAPSNNIVEQQVPYSRSDDRLQSPYNPQLSSSPATSPYYSQASSSPASSNYPPSSSQHGHQGHQGPPPPQQQQHQQQKRREPPPPSQQQKQGYYVSAPAAAPQTLPQSNQYYAQSPTLRSNGFSQNQPLPNQPPQQPPQHEQQQPYYRRGPNPPQQGHPQNYQQYPPQKQGYYPPPHQQQQQYSPSHQNFPPPQQGYKRPPPPLLQQQGPPGGLKSRGNPYSIAASAALGSSNSLNKSGSSTPKNPYAN